MTDILGENLSLFFLLIMCMLFWVLLKSLLQESSTPLIHLLLQEVTYTVAYIFKHYFICGLLLA